MILSAFVTAVVMLIGYWTVFPATLVSDSMLIPIGSTDYPHGYGYQPSAAERAVENHCGDGLTGMCTLSMLAAPMLMDCELVIAGLPPLWWVLIKLSLVGWLVTQQGSIPFPVVGKISGAISTRIRKSAEKSMKPASVLRRSWTNSGSPGVPAA